MTTRLPIPGSDDGTWGDILNSFLEVSLNSDGTIQSTALVQAGGITTSQVGQPSGVASLNSSGVVPIALLPTAIPLTNLSVSGTASSSTYLRGDGTWSTPNSGSSSLASDTDVSVVSPANNQVLTYNNSTNKWENLSPAVATVFGRTGTITAASGDYSASQVTGALVTTNNLSDVGDAGSSRANLHIPVLTPAAAVATSNISLATPGATIDGYSFTSGDLVLLTNQSTASQNGLYTWTGASSTLTRPTEFASGATIKGRTIEIQNGTVYMGTQWALSTPTGGITVDTSSQTWSNPVPVPYSTLETVLAPLASPTFIGTPTAPTATAGDNSTKIATTAFVLTASEALSSNNYVNSWTIGSTDIGIEDDYNSSNAGVATIPSGLTSVTGTLLAGRQLGTGTLTYTAASGVILNGVNNGSISTTGQYQSVLLRQTSSNTWVATVTQPAVNSILQSNNLLLPTGAIAENFPRLQATGEDLSTATSGQPYIWSGPLLPPGVSVHNINVYQSGTAPSGQTHAWLALLSISGVVLATTADAGSTAWSTNTFVAIQVAFSASYTPAAATQTLVAFLFAGTTSPTFRGCGGSNIQDAWPPYYIGKSASTGLTTAPTLGSTISLPTNGSNAIPYTFVS